jgi:hypothetical protein
MSFLMTQLRLDEHLWQYLLLVRLPSQLSAHLGHLNVGSLSPIIIVIITLTVMPLTIEHPLVHQKPECIQMC